MHLLINLLTYTWLALMLAGGIMSILNVKRDRREGDASREAVTKAVDRFNEATDKVEMQIITREEYNERYRGYLKRMDAVVEGLEC